MDSAKSEKSLNQLHSNFLPPQIRLELLWVIAILSVVLSLSIALYPPNINKARLAEVNMLVSQTQLALNEYYLINGNWPTTKQFARLLASQKASKKSELIQQVDYDGQGGLHVKLSGIDGLSELWISFRGATSIFLANGNLVWLCGYATVPEGYTSLSINQTNIAPSLLPFSCRFNEL